MTKMGSVYNYRHILYLLLVKNKKNYTITHYFFLAVP